MQRADAWAPVAERLGERYPSVLLDHRTWTREERIAEILAAAPAGAVPVGYSLGGRLVLHAALAATASQPERPHGWAALCLVGASAGPAAPAERRAADEELAAWIESRPIEEVVERWESLPIFASQPADLVAQQRPGRLAHDPRSLARLLLSAGQGAMEPVWDNLKDLDVPVLCIAGDLDAPYTEAARRMAAQLPRGTCATIPGCGHAPQLEDPDAVAAALGAFLDQHL